MTPVVPPVLAWAAGTAGLMYEHALIALVDVLGEAGEDHWQRRIEGDLGTWREWRDTSHHQQAYGGMGSLDDVTIWDQPWARGAFDQLRHLAGSVCRVAGVEPTRFVQYPANGPLLLGVFRCQACGSKFVASSDIDGAAATGWASFVIPKLVGAGRGDAVIAAVRGEVAPDERPAYRSYVASRLPELGLQQHDSDRYWESACPTCGELDWYRESLPIF